MTKSICIGVSGKLGGGKTTLASALAKRLRCQVASFGGFVRSEATRRGIPSAREQLQQLGEELIRDRGFTKFTLDVLEAAGWTRDSTIVVEGIRHVDIIKSCRDAVGNAEFFLAYIDTDEEERIGRIMARDLASAERIRRWHEHSTERELDAIRGLADFIVPGNGAPSGLADALLQAIQETGIDLCLTKSSRPTDSE
jgi:dephospho-CoA kinase